MKFSAELFFEKNAMKIFNKAKTHFMQKDEKGTHIIKFDTIENVQAKINSILDGNSQSSNNELFEFKNVKKVDQKSALINKIIMIREIKKCCHQSILFSLGMIFCCSLFAQNISQQQYQFSHKNTALACESTSYPLEKPQISSSKFVMGGKGFKHNNVPKNSHVPKNSSIIDYQIFASPKNIKSTKRIFI